MGKIYVITEGSYSDYHIIGVTTNEDIANAYVKIHYDDRYDGPRIETFDEMTDVSIIAESDNYIHVCKVLLDCHGSVYTHEFESMKKDDERYLKFKEGQFIITPSNYYNLTNIVDIENVDDNNVNDLKFAFWIELRDDLIKSEKEVNEDKIFNISYNLRYKKIAQALHL